MKKLTKSFLKRAIWLGRGTATVMGLAMLLALTVGLASTALAGTGVGARFDLGKVNTVNAVSSLIGNVSGPTLAVKNGASDRAATAVSLQMANPNLAPMQTNATGRVLNLNADRVDGRDSASLADGTNGKADDADRLDGLDSTQIGINGYKFVRAESAFDSNPFKFASADCPPGTMIVGGGGDVIISLFDPNHDVAPIALRTNGVDLNGSDHYDVAAVEVAPYGFEWRVFAMAVCARVGNP